MNGKQPVTTSKPTFAQVALNGSLNNKRKTGTSLHIFGKPTPLPGAKTITKDGIDISVFENEATEQLAAPYQWTLIGKFSHKIPNSQSVSTFFSKLKLHGEYEFQWLSHRQILIVLSEEEDYALIWTKGFWLINGCSMRTLKWTPTYNARFESPFAPVWISLPGLPIHLFEKRALHLIASQIGRPLMVDSPTASRKRATMARICVDIHLLFPLKKVINLCINVCLIEQLVIYENVPSCCDHCRHIGHVVDKCFVKFEELKIIYDERQAEKRRKLKGKSKMEGTLKLINHSGSSDEVHVTVLEENTGFTMDGVSIDRVALHPAEESNALPTSVLVEDGDGSAESNDDEGVDVSKDDGPPAVEIESGMTSSTVLQSGGEDGDANDDSRVRKGEAQGETKATEDAREEGEFVDGDPLYVDGKLDEEAAESGNGDAREEGEIEDDVLSIIQSTVSILPGQPHAEGEPLHAEGMNIVEGVESSGTSSAVVQFLPSQPTLHVVNFSPDDRATAIVDFLTPFGVDNNLASILESDPVALIKFLDKHPSMELYWDENSVLQCVDRDSGEYIAYDGINYYEEQQYPHTPPNQPIVFAEPLQTIYRPHCYYPDMEALRAHLIPESDGSEVSLDDSDEDFEDTDLFDSAAYNSDYSGRITRSMARNGKAIV